MSATASSLNPVCAGLAARPEDWAWSSVRAHLAGVDDGLIVVKPLVERFGAAGLADFIEGLERLLGRPIARRAPGRKPAPPALDQPKLL